MPTHRSILPRNVVRAGAVTLAAGVVVATAAAPASAHVTVSPDTTAAGSYAVLTFAVPHGCEGSPTTEVAIAMPEEIPQVTPTRNALWEVEKVSEKLDEPIADGHGNEITERVAEVVYTTDEPLPEGYRDTFELSVQLPEAAGETLTFPVVQTCEQGETGWTEVAAEGQDSDELERPAPAVTITEAAEDGHGGGEEAADTEAADTEESEQSNGLAVAGLVAGIAGILVGGVALLRGRKG
jgi:periplasmic copper chaperone A